MAVSIGGTDYFWGHKRSCYDAIIYAWKSMTLIKLIEVIYVIYLFILETPYDEYIC